MDFPPPSPSSGINRNFYISLMHSASQTELHCVFMFLKAFSKGLDSLCFPHVGASFLFYVRVMLPPWGMRQCSLGLTNNATFGTNSELYEFLFSLCRGVCKLRVCCISPSFRYCMPLLFTLFSQLLSHSIYRADFQLFQLFF